MAISTARISAMVPSLSEDLTRRLPTELLISIFEHTMLDDDEDPPSHSPCTTMSVGLSHVCSRWRTVAVEFKQLWSQIHLHWPKELADLYVERAGTEVPLSFFFCDEHIRRHPSKGYTGHESDSVEWDGRGRFPTPRVEEAESEDGDDDPESPVVPAHDDPFVEETDPQRALASHVTKVTPVGLLALPGTLSRTKRLHFNMGNSQGHPYGTVGSVAQKLALQRPLPALDSYTLLVAESVVWKASHGEGPVQIDRLRTLRLTKIFLHHTHTFLTPFISSLSLSSVHFAVAPDGHRVNLGVLLGSLPRLEVLSLINVTGFGIAPTNSSPPIVLSHLKHATFHCFTDEVVYILDTIGFPATATIDCGIIRTDFFYHINVSATGAQPLYTWASLLASAVRRRFRRTPAHFTSLAIGALGSAGGCKFSLSHPSDSELLPAQLTLCFEDARRKYPSYIDVPAFVAHVLPLLPCIACVTRLEADPLEDWKAISWSGVLPSLSAVEAIDAHALPAVGLMHSLAGAEPFVPGLEKLSIRSYSPSDISELGEGVMKLKSVRPAIDVEFVPPIEDA